jgi:hypothetical protein
VSQVSTQILLASVLNASLYKGNTTPPTDTAAIPGGLRPSSSYADQNASIRIHQHTPAVVARKYAEKVLRFQAIEPRITESAPPRWEQTPILGRSENYLTYAGGENRKIQLNLSFVASIEAYDDGHFDTALRCARWLQSLQYPTYENGRSYPPPLCLLVFGSILAERGVVTACEVSHGPAFVGGPDSAFENEYPLITEVQLEFTCSNVAPLQASDLIPKAGEWVRPIGHSTNPANL